MEWFRRSNISMDIKITEHLPKATRNGEKLYLRLTTDSQRHLRKDNIINYRNIGILGSQKRFQEGTDLNKLHAEYIRNKDKRRRK